MQNANEANQSEIFALLTGMYDSMEKLFTSMGIDEKAYPLYPSNQLFYFFETALNRGAVLGNVKVLSKKISMAAQKSAEINADRYALTRELKDITAENETLRSEVERLNKQNAQLEQQLSAENSRNQDVNNQLQQADRKAAELENTHQKQLVEQLMTFISFRDSLVMREGLAKDQQANDYIKLFSGLLIETGNALNKCGVTVMDEKGHFDPARHIVKQVVSTDDESLQDEIAEVFRPGYKLHDIVLRPEEVIVYSYKRV